MEDTSFHPEFLGETYRRLGIERYPACRQFVVQHLFPDTVRLLLILHQCLPIDTVIGISYSGSSDAVQSLRDRGIRVLTPQYAELATTVSAELTRCVEECRTNREKLVIHEVGGFAIRAAHEPQWIGEDVILGALEITKQGVWVAEGLDRLRIPQLNVAQTRLKQTEGKLVGEAVVASLDTILREMGYATVGRDAVVCGYGWVGKGVARSLQQRGMSVVVSDPDVVTLVDAAVDGFVAQRNLQRLAERQPAIVIGASGHRSIDAALLDALPDRCFLVSAASKNHEIDVPHLDALTRVATRVHPHVMEHRLSDDRRLYLVNQGYPVNFTGASVPDEIVEFLFAELIMLVPLLMSGDFGPGIYPLPPEHEALAASIWFDLR